MKKYFLRAIRHTAPPVQWPHIAATPDPLPQTKRQQPMIRRHFATLAVALALPLAFGAHAQTAAYPAKPIRMIVPFPPGGGTDILARLVAQKLTETAHWTVVPDNRAGAGGTIGIAEAARAAPTGYDIVMGQKDNMVVAPWIYKNLSYNPVKDLTAVAHVAYTPVVIVTNANSKFKTLDDVVKAARAAPDSITFGSPGNGTTIHLAGEIFNSAAKIKMRHVPYKGSNAAMLRPLAVTSARRSTSLPDTPTVAELGYKGFDVSTWYGIFVPAKTPKDVVATLNTEINKLLATPEMQAAIIGQGAEPQSMTPEQFGKLLKADYEQWKGIVQASGATIE
jgi:tripartite-type tricarboxylate transporter receptor subunit TctC